MNICLIGDGLTNLILAKILANRNINVSICSEVKKIKKFASRTIGISKHNFDFFKSNIVDIKKISWPINYIQVFNELNQKEEILNFGSTNNQLFYIVKHNELYESAKKNIEKNKFIKKIKIKKSFYDSIIKNSEFDLIINSDMQNKISKEIFFKRINKDYKSVAFTAIIKHQKCINYKAVQIFTRFGPLAFLPCSNTETSIVFSALNEKKSKSEKDIKELINKYNKYYKINSFSIFEKFNLKFSIPRKYYYKNILCFGDNLHKIHPLAGQGFNMTLRDIKILSDLIDKKIDLGLPLDSSIFKEFELKTKHLNYIFSSGINFIHEFFKFDNKCGNNYSKKILKYLGKNELFNKYTSKFADQGLVL